MLNLEDLGSGFPLYYQLKTFTIIIYILMILIVGIAGLTLNELQKRGDEWNGGDSPAIAVKMSIGNYGKSPGEYNKGGILTQTILNFIFIFVIILGSVLLRKLQNKVINEIDEKNLTPSDFCVMATGLPVNKTQDEVIAYLKEILPSIEVCYVNYCYDIKEIVTTARKLRNLNNVKSYILAYRKRKLKDLNKSEGEAAAEDIDLHPPPTKTCCC